MNNELLKMMIEGAVKALPQIVDKLSRPEFLVQDLTMAEFVSVFLSNPNSPQCFITTTPLPPEEVLKICQALCSQLKAEMSLAMTKDNWQVLLADKEKAFWGVGTDKLAHRLLVAVNRSDSEMTTVIIGCRFTEVGKLDVFNMYKKAAIKKIDHVLSAIQPNKGLENLA